MGNDIQGIDLDMTNPPNRHERRQAAKQSIRRVKSKVEAKDANRRRDNRMNAQEINRLKLRRIHGIPEPTWSEQVQADLKEVIEPIIRIMSAFAESISDEEDKTNALVGLMIAVVTAILLCLYDRYVTGRATSPFVALNTSLSIISNELSDM